MVIFQFSKMAAAAIKDGGRRHLGFLNFSKI